MKKLEFSDILNVLCEDLGLTPGFKRPFSYDTFKRVMLCNDLIVTESVIKTRWEQLLSMVQIVTKGKTERGEIVATIDVQAARIYIMSKGKKPWTIENDREIECEQTNTETHTKEGSQ